MNGLINQSAHQIFSSYPESPIHSYLQTEQDTDYSISARAPGHYSAFYLFFMLFLFTPSFSKLFSIMELRKKSTPEIQNYIFADRIDNSDICFLNTVESLLYPPVYDISLSLNMAFFLL